MLHESGAVASPRGLLHRVYTDDFLETVDRWCGVPGPPSAENRRRREGIRVFRSGFVEKYFSKAHPATPIVLTGPIMAFGLYRALSGAGGLWGSLLGFAAGILLWSFVEYALHRFLFHWKPRTPGQKLFWFMLHGYHHEFPDDKMRLVAPPLMFFVLGLAVGSVYFLVFGVELWAQVFAGTAVGYVGYDWIHYYTHHFHPRGGPGKWLRTYHLRHHFQDEGSRYGISSPLCDLLFGSYRAPDAP